jgi:uncharacterized membrane protein YcaP (DUF421 family)
MEQTNLPANASHPPRAHAIGGPEVCMEASVRALLFYFFLVLVVRIVGRRPGKQITPFEFVLVFFMGGLALTAMVGDDASLTNAFIQIFTVALAHYGLATVRAKSSRLARLLDGTPLILLENGMWRSNTLSRMRIQDDDVMAQARDQGIATLDKIEIAILERNGQISVIEG